MNQEFKALLSPAAFRDNKIQEAGAGHNASSQIREMMKLKQS